MCSSDLLNGLELLEQVPPSASETPFVMLTTEAQPTMMRQARANGAKAWLVKPLSPDVLVATVKRLSTLVV